MIIEFIKKQLTLKLSYIGHALLAFLVLNGFWLVVAQWVFVFRPYLNYDYALALMAAPFSTVLAVLSLLTVCVFELFITNALVFHFDGAVDFFNSVEFAKELDLKDFVNVQDTAFLIAFIILAAVVSRYLKSRTNALSVLCVIILAFGADQLNGSSYLFKSDHQIIEGNVGGSSMLKLYASFKERAQDAKPLVFLDHSELPLRADDLMRWAEQHPDKSVLFVIVESFGLNSDEGVRDWLLSELKSEGLEDSYIIESGAAAFVGSTTASEFRHLCGLKGNYSSVVTSEFTEQCLPQLFAQKGYSVAGAHGFSANMFRRRDWWSQLGLQEQLFVDEFNDMDAPYCGSGLYGTCDSFVVEYLGRRIQEAPGFYYQLTLNTHLPIVKTDVPEALRGICRAAEMTSEACVLNAKVGQYLRDLSGVVSMLSNKPYVFIVGDHAPPFSATATRRSFSDHETPYMILKPLD